ncbi:MAG: TonB-dependent receptor family protein [Sphingomonadaceae bacterium]
MLSIARARLAPALVLLAASPALAQGVGNRTDLADIVVTASLAGSLTAPTDAEARRSLERIPGAIGFVPAAAFADDFTQSLGDALLWTPGVFADTSAQRESRISIRGSGLNSGFERRGIAVYRDGVPITRASGSTEFQEVDPLAIQRLEVFKGANGLRLGAASLGGAIDIITPTAASLGATAQLRIEGGSFRTRRAGLQLGATAGPGDIWVGVTALASDGFRDHSEVRSIYGFANAGLKLSETVETRFFLTALQDNFELAGGLGLTDALANPRAAGRPVLIPNPVPGRPPIVLDPGPEADDWDRNLGVVRLANRTVADLGSAKLETALWVSHRTLDHAITRLAGIIDQSEDELGASLQLSNAGGAAREPVEWAVGLMANAGWNEARTFANNGGRRGALRSESRQNSANLVAWGQLDAGLLPALRLIAGAQFAAARREVEARLNAVPGRRSFRQLSPRLGLLWTPAEQVQLFANVQRSFEPPSIADLTAGGAFPFAPLEAQRAWTVEAGARGQAGILAFDIALYRAEVRDEFIDQLAPNGRTSVTVNADRTLRQGLEAGLDLFLLRDLGPAGLGLVARGVWTLNDFRFAGDPRFGNNRLAGVPRNVIAAELRLDGAAGWYLGTNLRWVPRGPFVDYANTTSAPGYDLWGLTAGWTLAEKLSIFGSVENLFDTRHIANVATVADQSRERAAAFTPGQGRALFIGATSRF